MKNTILIAITILFTACTAQKTITMKKFDIQNFHNNKDSISNEYNRTLNDGTIVEQMELKKVFVETVKQKESLFEIKSQYYKNGNLKITGEFFNSSFKKGIWREYDEQGNLIKETDYDKGFEYTWEDLLKYLKKRKVNISDTRNTDIRKENGNWRFSYVEGVYIYDVTVDGKTGKVIDDTKNIFEEGS